MTAPYMMNCDHQGEGWCLACVRSLHEERDVLLGALKVAYRYHHLGDDSIGSNELSDMMCNALCEAMGDKAFQAWLRKKDWRDA